ncbi:cellulose binding domain-containing protein [Oerskovia sp. M15]
MTNAAWNGTLAAGGSATFGFIGTGSAPTAPSTVTCAGS